MAKTWTEERRQKQREAIRRTKPWEKSTGPKTAKGKKRARLNALKHGRRRASIKYIKALLRANRDFRRNFILANLMDDGLLSGVDERTVEEFLKNNGISE